MVLNDIHSRLNLTLVSRIESPGTLGELKAVVASAADAGESLSVVGGRHATGGQQFLSAGVALDTSGLKRILGLDAERGLVRVESGILWDALVSGLREKQHGAERRWSIVQKQTGADRLSIGGALAANGHDPGLTYAPIVQDVESLKWSMCREMCAIAAVRKTRNSSVWLSAVSACLAWSTRQPCA